MGHGQTGLRGHGAGKELLGSLGGGLGQGERQADPSAFLKTLESPSQGIQASPQLPEMTKGGWMGR